MKGPRWLVPALAAAVTATLCAAAYEHFASRLPPLHADETGHALPAARLASDLRGADLAAFVAHTQRETTWPFVHPWALCAAFLVGGTTTEVARGTSLAFFGTAVVLALLLARELARPPPYGAGDAAQVPVGAGWPTVALMLLNRDFWAQSSHVMIEPLGMALTLAALLAHAAAVRRGSPGRFLLAGLLAALTFLTKYNYGLPLVAAVVLSQLLARPSPGRRQLAGLLAGTAVPIAAWLAYPFAEKLRGLLAFAVNRDEGIEGMENLLFYPVEIASLVSWPVCVAVLGAAVLSTRHVRRPRVCAPALFALLSLVMITAHPNKQVRYCFTALPVLFVVAELESRTLMAGLLGPRARALVWALVLASLGLALDPRPALTQLRREAEPLRDAGRIVEFLLPQLDPEGRTLVLGSTGLLPHLLIQWELVSRTGVQDPVVEWMPFPGPPAEHRRGYPAELTAVYARELEAALWNGRYDRVVTLEIPPGSPFLPDWMLRWDAWGQNYVALMVRRERPPLRAERSFPGSDVRVRVYGSPP